MKDGGDAIKPTVIYLSLDRSETFEHRHQFTTNAILRNANLREAKTAEQFHEFCEDPKLVGIVVTDTATIEPTSERNKSITEKLVTLVKDNGITVIYGLDFAQHLYSADMNDQDSDAEVIETEPGIHLVDVREVERYMKRNWDLNWCPDDDPRTDEHSYFDMSSLYSILDSKTYLPDSFVFTARNVRQVSYEHQQVVLYDPCSDATGVAFTSHGNGYIGMTGELQRCNELQDAYLGMLGFWGFEGVREWEEARMWDQEEEGTPVY